MERIHPLENPIQRYAWGSRTALAELQGRPAPTPEPEAELWIGAHPRAPSRVRDDTGWVPLTEWIARDPAAILGRGVAARFGGELPFLLKVLAVERPLSLQAHPDAVRAREGFERENRAGIPLDAPERSYCDPRHKPELVCALTPFRALKGFRPLEQVRDRLEAFGLAHALPGFAAFRERPGAEAWKSVFRALLRLGGERRCELVSTAVNATAGAAGDDPSLAWVARLARTWPGDVGALAPLFLNFVELEPGQALFLPAGELHCYLEGVAVEVAASSDNVLRGGLTTKHVDVDEFVRVTGFGAAEPEPLPAKAVSAFESAYCASAEEFQLSVITLRPGSSHVREGVTGIEILLCTEGAVSVTGPDQAEGRLVRRGEAVLVSAAATVYGLEGVGTLYRVTVPGS